MFDSPRDWWLFGNIVWSGLVVFDVATVVVVVVAVAVAVAVDVDVI